MQLWIATNHFTAYFETLKRNGRPDTSVWFTPPPLEIFITLTNRYQEVLQDSAKLEGTLEIMDLRRPGVGAIVQLKNPVVIQTYALNQGWLTLEPNVPITLRFGWDHMTTKPPCDSIRPIWLGVDTTTVEKLPGFYTIVDADPIILGGPLSFQPFEVLAASKQPHIQFTLYYRLNYNFMQLRSSDPRELSE